MEDHNVRLFFSEAREGLIAEGCARSFDATGTQGGDHDVPEWIDVSENYYFAHSYSVGLFSGVGKGIVKQLTIGDARM